MICVVLWKSLGIRQINFYGEDLITPNERRT
jgi:hypothetical protein